MYLIKNIPNKCAFLTWIGILSLFFSFSGYSNYTAPINKEITIELVVSQEKKASKELSISFRFKKEKTTSVLLFNGPKIKYLSAYHGRQSSVRGKTNTFFVSTTKKLVVKYAHHSSYPSEEDLSFHVGS